MKSVLNAEISQRRGLYIMKLHIIYLIAMNIIGFLAMLIDKQKAIRRRWRIPEKTLFFIVIMGGSLGGVLGMTVFRHKNKQIKFKYGFPIILIIQISLMYLLFPDFLVL